MTLARTALGRAGRGATAVLVLGSNVPDADAVTMLDSSLSYLEWHRGPTHGVPGMLLLGAVTGWLVWMFCRARDARRPSERDAPHLAPPAALAGLGMLAASLHVAMDLPTAYGTRVLSPFAAAWFTTDWMPIVDVYLLSLLIGGLIVGRRPSLRQAAAVVVLLLMIVNYGVRAVAHGRAIADAPHMFTPRLPEFCEGVAVSGLARWEHRPRVPPPPGGTRCVVDVAAMPTFFSPFRWRVIARTTDTYEIQEIDLMSGPNDEFRRRRLARRVPDHWTPAVRRAAESQVAQRFLSFSRFPAVRSRLEEDGVTTVQWTDLRFALPAAGLAQRARGDLFSATVRVSADGRILEQRLGN